MGVHIARKEPLSKYSTFRIGGPAEFLAIAEQERDVVELLSFARQNAIPWIVIGKGSNCLFDSRGYRGLVIVNKLESCCYDGAKVTAGSGMSFAYLGISTAKQGLSGLEFASGIPGTVGGAVFMNAGANGSETRDYLTEVRFVTSAGDSILITKKEMTFSYRKSSFHDKEGVIISAAFELYKDPLARKRQSELLKKRIETQPYKDPSAGCVFQNPQGLSAGKLIDIHGLKNKAVGDAIVSPVHANFIVNKGSATHEDVLALIEEIRAVIAKEEGISLSMEIRYIPYE